MNRSNMNRFLFSLRVFRLNKAEDSCKKGNLASFWFCWQRYVLQKQSSDESHQNDDPAEGIKENEVAKGIDEHTRRDHGNNLCQENAEIQNAFHPSALCEEATSTVQALNAASLAVEPKQLTQNRFLVIFVIQLIFEEMAGRMTTLLIKNAQILVTIDDTTAGRSRAVVFLCADGFIEQVGRFHRHSARHDADEVLDLNRLQVVLARPDQHPPPLLPDPHTRRAREPKNANLFNWLKTLYPIWGRKMHAAMISISPPKPPWPNWPYPACTAASDHLYLIPERRPGWTTRSLAGQGSWTAACTPHGVP